MRALLISALALVVCGSAFGQTTDQRVAAIWDVATNRMLSQQNAWFDDGDFPACINLMGFESLKWPADYDIWTNLGWMQENVQEWDAALNTYQVYRTQNPGLTDSSLPEAQYYFMKKQYDKVPDLLEPVIKNRCHPNNYRILAWAYERLKKYPDAVRVWKVYLATGAKDAAAERNMARDQQRATDPASK